MTSTVTSSSTTVLVTGGSGFIGSYAIKQLLDTGYTVRTTVRSLKREAEVRLALQNAGVDAGDRLSFIAANLEHDEGWEDAVKGCDYVLHVASPFPLGVPKHEDELIIPAREGTLRILRAARDAKVKRVVLTSSSNAISQGYLSSDKVFTEKDWTILDGKIPVEAYSKSKTIAEKAAFDFIKAGGGSLELAVVNPVAIFGPVLGADYSPSIHIIKKLMDGSVPGCPQLYFSGVDVRDVADLHIRAMTNPAANGERFLAVNDSGCFSMLEMAKIIIKNRPNHAKKIPTRQLPNFLVRFLALFDPAIRLVVSDLDKVMRFSNEKAKGVLGWTPRSTEESILDTVDSLLAHKIV